MRSLLLILSLASFFAGCKAGCHAPGHHESLHNKLKRLPPASLPAHALTKLPPPPAAKDAIRIEDHPHAAPFFALRRTRDIQRYPCSGCHDGTPQPSSPERFQATHGAITLQHAPAGTLQCKTCHQPHQMNRLRLPAGGSVDLDHVHKLCGSCHQKQAEDWAGGAHGKRIEHWGGTRTVQNCTGCHNPHQPRFPKRWPSIRYRPYKPR